MRSGAAADLPDDVYRELFEYGAELVGRDHRHVLAARHTVTCTGPQQPRLTPANTGASESLACISTKFSRDAPQRVSCKPH